MKDIKIIKTDDNMLKHNKYVSLIL